jgi:hypothetical protein
MIRIAAPGVPSGMIWLATTAFAVDWQDWDDDVFARARAEHKLVLLDVGAVWCHWCHVMDEQTYADPAIEARMERSFVAVRVDQDARPDVSQRYEDWGWPATVLFAADGTELAKLRGYLPPERFGAILDAFVADPTPGPSAVPEAMPQAVGPSLRPADRDALLDRWNGAWDPEEGGWGRITKALDWPSVELALVSGQADRALRTVTLQRGLVDPVWGGAYQYSDGGVWDSPHFEKIVPIQADDLRAFALAWAIRRDESDRAAARSIVGYVDRFLWDDGYRASQDADLVPGQHAADFFARSDAERLALGIPRVDPHRYARENGLLAAALADASGWLGDPAMLADAERAARWSIANRSVPGGGFSHDAHDVGGPWLADTLAMGEAFLALHRATADAEWQRRAVDAVRYVDRTFQTDLGYRTSAEVDQAGLPPLRHREENARLARLAAELARETGDASLRAVADRAMALCAAVALDGNAPPVLLADRELRTEPLHVVVVGDARGKALYDAARALPLTHRWLEWRAEPGDDLPPVDVPTAFVCGSGSCSPPVTDPAKLAAAARR